MKPTVYRKTNQRFFETTGRTLQVFPSGLLRVDATFVVPLEFLASVRQDFAIGQILTYNEVIGGTNAKGAARIFPAPRESYEIPGFCKLSVSAYDKVRVEAGFLFTLGKQIVTIQQSFTEAAEEEDQEDFQWTIIEKWLVDTVTTTSVIESASTDIGASVPILLRENLVNRRILGRVSEGGTRVIDVTWQEEFTAVSRRNFGAWHEVDVTKSKIPIYG
jgi:hypothetical protein